MPCYDLTNLDLGFHILRKIEIIRRALAALIIAGGLYCYTTARHLLDSKKVREFHKHGTLSARGKSALTALGIAAGERAA